MKLKLTPSLRNEWEVRCIEDVVPSLATIQWRSASVIEVDDSTAAEIKADCEFYIDPDAVDATVGERSTYRALLRQIENASVVLYARQIDLEARESKKPVLAYFEADGDWNVPLSVVPGAA